jgi:hypothetical protein
MVDEWGGADLLREECVEETAEVDVGVGELTLYA